MPSELEIAFWRLHEALMVEASFARFCFDVAETRKDYKDPEVVVRRAKQLERAAAIVRRVRQALDGGPGTDSDAGLGWAGRFMWPEAPLHPRQKLAPLKEEALDLLVQCFVLGAQVHGAHMSESELEDRFGHAGRAIRESIDCGSSPALLKACESVRKLVLDGRFRRAFELKKHKISTKPMDAQRLASAILNASEKRPTIWTDVELMAQEVLSAFGVPKGPLRQAFEYRRKRQERV